VAEAARNLAVLARRAGWKDQALSIALNAVALAQRRDRDRDRDVRALLTAEHLASQEAHSRPAVRSLVAGLLLSGRITPELRALDARARVHP
jgi:hypothetical protein